MPFPTFKNSFNKNLTPRGNDLKQMDEAEADVCRVCRMEGNLFILQ